MHPSPWPWIKVLRHNPFQPENELMNFQKALTMTNFLEQPCQWLYFIDAIYTIYIQYSS